MSDAQQPLHALPQGHRLQEYELMRVLGFGGFGMTYLGFDHNLDKAVAIKEYLPSDIATRTADRSVAPQASDFHGDFQWGLDRFLDEARTLARFDHRHIIKVHRFFEAHGTAYIVMEYAEGETLSAHLERKGTLSEAELKGILYPLLDGLAVVHGADFLHRDIKPGNIVLRDADGSPVLLDFGAARQAIGAKSRSVTSIVTPGYAPIEQYSSRGHQGAWTDIYALGGVCYRALTGQMPDDATDRMRNDPLVPVSQRCAGRASGAFLSAIDVALSVDEGDRPPSVGVWREALGASVSAPARRQAQGERRREQATQRVPLPAPASRAGETEELVDAVKGQKDAVDDAPVVRRSEPNAPPSKSPNQPLFKWLVVVLGVVAVLVGGKMFLDHAEQVVLDKRRREQVVLDKQRREQVVLDKQRREQAALDKQRREQAALDKQRREQVALDKQRREQAVLDKQRREQVALDKQRREQAVLDKQRREQAALEKQRQERQSGRRFKDCAACPEMVVVPTGSFIMGSSSSEKGRDSDEGPQHRVRIAQPFAVGVYEVTFAEWDACVSAGGCNGHSPADRGWGRGQYPVIYVSWNDAQAYVKWLSNETGKRYRLLSEAEWEYVARAGTETPFHFGMTISTDQANYNRNYRAQTVEAGSFPSNGYGLHDVHGNVDEWVQDCWNDSYLGAPTDGSAWTSGDCSGRVLRGGSWDSKHRNLHLADRDWGPTNYRSIRTGFRVARTF